MIEVYGIKNCDTMKKAFRWLDDHKIEYRFHDYKKEGLDVSIAKAWIDQLGWENVINKRGTTWRKLDEEIKNTMDNEKAVNIVVKQSSMIKRPLLIQNDAIHLGFNAEEYAQKLL
ncbi:ArsC family transcriptional regulator [Marinomonas ushuaiensis DSM 15871]|uniref:ArsC family transcriptional regulator n=1 Tax=Marinomonas ushuaiensis DSM 15871 TaxID=1122207 RepID=X7E687_9GAMM|nr:ArsC family reductase [Marinomonas ushuaiensis]ETX10706.1 ArsC family transcriptional regulator [Marinomonas ushuaiensis DSM 15871]